MFLCNLSIIILFGSTGWTAFVEDISDGLERTRKVNVRLLTNFIHTDSKNYPEKNIVLTSLTITYTLGLLATFAKCQKDSKKLVQLLNFTSLSELQDTIPVLTSECLSYDNTISAWTSTVYADVSNRFTRSFVDVGFNTFDTNVRNTDFKNPDLAAHVINEMANVVSLGYGSSGNSISPDVIAADGRYFVFITNYFEGSFLGYVNPCDTQYRDFYLPNGKVTQLPTMSMRGEYGYGRLTEFDAEVLESPLRGGDYLMRIVMPACYDHIQAILWSLSEPSRYDETFSSLKTQEMIINMPVINIHKNNNDFVAYFKKYFKNFDLKSIAVEGIFEQPDNSYFSQLLVDINFNIVEGRSYSNYSDPCHRNQIRTVDINLPIIYYICTRSGIPMLGGIFTGID